MNQTAAAEAHLFAALEGVPNTDIHANLRAALAAGRRVTALVREAAALRYGRMKLAPQEFFYYRLWDPEIPMAEKRRFVGEVRQRDMHNACNSQAWYASAADKVLWHILGSRHKTGRIARLSCKLLAGHRNSATYYDIVPNLG